MSNDKVYTAYWFEPADGVLGYGDGRKPEVGVIHYATGEPVLCQNGMHASLHPSDALKYAASGSLWLVGVFGDVHIDDDKLVGSARRYVQRADVTNVLRKFARDCALRNIEKAKPYFSAAGWLRCTEYLKTGDEGTRKAARSAAEAATRLAARSAPRRAADSPRRAAEFDMRANLLQLIEAEFKV